MKHIKSQQGFPAFQIEQHYYRLCQRKETVDTLPAFIIFVQICGGFYLNNGYEDLRRFNNHSVSYCDLKAGDTKP